MKKNRMMRLASVLLVCVLLTTSVISGTFAKYTTTASSSDNARVAYWGFQSTNSMDLTNLFSTQYIKEKVDSNGTVKSADGDDVIAPGTAGSASFAFAYAEIGGTAAADTTAQAINAPEVKYSFTVAVEESCAEAIKNNKNIQWKLDEGTWGSWDDMITAIKNLSGSADGSGTATYEAGNLPAAFSKSDDTHTISWQWLFETADDTTTANVDEMAAQDAIDTEMGNKAILDTCSIKITITATQID